MPKVRALVPLQDEEGQIAPGEVVDVSDEKAAEWRSAGKVSLVEAEGESAPGVYDAVTKREDTPTPPLDPNADAGPGPQGDDPAPKKGKK